MGIALEKTILGALSGIVATMAMTAAMRRLEPLLGEAERYPLPPSELVAQVRPRQDPRRHWFETVLTHFAFGAAAGALFTLLPRRVPGPAYGAAIWAASYLGWIPAARLLRPAHRHPWRRNLLMLAVHLVWGQTLASSVTELEHSGLMFRQGGASDAPLPGKVAR